ncbi:MAG: universal stress protein [Thermoleophilia bacterium]
MLATDGSRFSEGAVKAAVSLAGKCSNRLVAISVVEANDEYAAQAPGRLEAARSLATAAGIACETAVHIGDSAWRQIVAEAEDRSADLIVVGCHGGSGIGKLLMGSVTERVIGHAGCAVMVACS